MGIVEIIVILVVALIVVPPENLPDVMRAAGKLMRELRLASNMVIREITAEIEEPPPVKAAPAGIAAASPGESAPGHSADTGAAANAAETPAPR